jgi:hypothetical protein
MYSHQNLSPIKFLANLLAGLMGSGNSGLFPGDFGFPRNSRLGPDILDLYGRNTIFTVVFSFYTALPR